MKLPMTFWMKQHAIVGFIFAALHSVNDMVVMPSRQFRDELVADRTDALLFFPEA